MKKTHWKKRGLSLLLAFSLVMSLFTGQIILKSEAQAAGDTDKIELGSLSKSADGTYYTYPGATINYSDSTKKFTNLTVSVDSGHLRVTSTAIAGITGKGIVAGNDMNQDYKELNTTDKYEAILFDWSTTEGVSKEDIQNFIRTIRFTTSNNVQTVSMHATTKSSQELKTTVNGKSVNLYYFNGHYYGYVTNNTNISWTDAYDESKSADFCGTKGYLATLTTRAEDRFILASFKWFGNFAKKGWMGCTRAKLADGSSYEDAKTQWKELDTFHFETNQENFIWRWVSGPEAGQRFGYQSNAYGDGTNGDGGFVTDDGIFSNWNTATKTNSHVEPNGGASTNEAYGYYGEYEYGRWNDYENNGGISGYYIEFGGNDGDEQKYQEQLDQIIITTKETSSEVITDGSYDDTPNSLSISGKPVILNQNKDADGKDINEVGSILLADVTGVSPDASHSTLSYQWYIKEGDSLTPIDGASRKTYTLTAQTVGKELVVKAAGEGIYTGVVTSDPYTASSSTESEKTAISGTPAIINETKDNEGNEIKKEGTVLTADITGITPSASQDTLTYQWYTKDGNKLTPIDGATGKSYVLTSDTVDKKLVVKVSGTGDYTGDAQSEPYDTTRTNSGISVDDGEDSGGSGTGGSTQLPEGKRIITIHPTVKDTIYAIKDENGNVYGAGTLSALPAMDGNGNELTPNVTDEDYPGYYEVEPGGKIIFIVDKDKNYIIHEVKTTSTNTEVISPTIPDSDIKTDYNTNNTQDTEDDTISIVIDPALSDYKYAVLKKENGKYIELAVTKDANGNYVASSSSTNAWSDGGENKITFSNLPANGIYRVVAISNSESADTIIKELSPDKIIGGSKDITVDMDIVPTNTPAPTAATTATPSATGLPDNNTFTTQEKDKAAQFVKEHATAPDGKIITKITDMTRDIVVSGETEWNTMTDREKAAVNTRLKEQGCPYTYEELLQMAKKYKIPGFKLHKVMKKNTTAKLKLIKCKGATIVCTSTNKKVATVNKKGIIKAKKVGRATLTFTAIKGKYTNRLVVNIEVRKKFKNAKELKNFKAKQIKTPTVLIAKKRLLKKSTKIKIYDLKKSSKVQFKAYNKKVLKLTKKGRYTGKKKGSSLVQAKVKQNNKTYILYVYVSIFKK